MTLGRRAILVQIQMPKVRWTRFDCCVNFAVEVKGDGLQEKWLLCDSFVDEPSWGETLKHPLRAQREAELHGSLKP